MKEKFSKAPVILVIAFSFSQAAIYSNPDLAQWSKFAITSVILSIVAMFVGMSENS